MYLCGLFFKMKSKNLTTYVTQLALLCLLIASISTAHAQDTPVKDSTAKDTTAKVQLTLDHNNPKQYVIADITVSGIKYLNPEQILSFTGLVKGDTISLPSEEISFALKKLWAQRFFSDVGISATKIVDNKIYLDIHLTERPRVSTWDFKGIKKGDKTDLREKLHLRRGGELSDYIIKTSIDLIQDFYSEKGYRKAEVNVIH